jgi:hypothetical protein
MYKTEPLIHSHITDSLPKDHLMANESQFCQICKGMVHAFNNECMRTWIEWEGAVFCFDCFCDKVVLTQGVLSDIDI